MFVTLPSQLLLFAIFFALGFAFALVHTMVGFVMSHCFWAKSKRVGQLLLYAADFFASILLLGVAYAVNITVSYGVVRMFEVLSLVFGFAICQQFIAVRLALPLKKCYDWLQTKRKEKQKA